MTKWDRVDACREGNRLAKALRLVGSEDAAAIVDRLCEWVLEDEQVVRFGQFSEALDEARALRAQAGVEA